MSIAMRHDQQVCTTLGESGTHLHHKATSDRGVPGALRRAAADGPGHQSTLLTGFRKGALRPECQWQRPGSECGSLIIVSAEQSAESAAD